MRQQKRVEFPCPLAGKLGNVHKILALYETDETWLQHDLSTAKEREGARRSAWVQCSGQGTFFPIQDSLSTYVLPPLEARRNFPRFVRFKRLPRSLSVARHAVQSFRLKQSSSAGAAYCAEADVPDSGIDSAFRAATRNMCPRICTVESILAAEKQLGCL